MDRKESLKQGELCILGLTEILQEQEARSLGNWNIGDIKTLGNCGRTERENTNCLCLSTRIAEHESGCGTDRLWISERAKADSLLSEGRPGNLMGGISGRQAVRIQAGAIDLPL